MVGKPQFNREELERKWALTVNSCECENCQWKVAGLMLLGVLDAWQELDKCPICKNEDHDHVQCPVKACLDVGLGK